MTVRIVTDSTADIPPTLATELGIVVVPLTVHFGDRVFRDGVDLDAAGFLEQLASNPALPHTAQPSPAEFAAVYGNLLTAGDEIVSVHISAKLSGTMNSALLARQECGAPERVTIIDSQTTSMALGLVTIAAARAARSGAAREAIAAQVAADLDRSRLLLFVDTMEFLQRGGRIGRAAAFLGGLLSVKPMITLQNGEVHPLERVRTRSRAIERLWSWAAEHPAVRQFCVLHIGSEAGAAGLFQRLSERFPQAEGYTAPVGPVVGTHVGPGALGITLLA